MLKDPVLFASDKSQLNCTPPLCASCLAAKARRKASGAKHVTVDPEIEDILRSNDMDPGSVVSVDQYESSVRGRLPSSRGREAMSQRYVGGTLFYDHASGKIFVRHQKSLSAYDMINAKRSVE